MRVLRIERNGKGVYRNDAGENAPIDDAIQLIAKRRGGYAPEFSNWDGALSPYRHPTPLRDVPGFEALYDRQGEAAAQAYFCGFHSMAQLVTWFDSEAIRSAMNEVGCKLVTYEVADKHVMTGDWQIMFRMSEAQVVSSGPIPTLAPPLASMQPAPAAHSREETPPVTRLSAAELGVTPDDYAALLETREILSRPLPDGLGFDMTMFLNSEHPCGTACCIGGYMRLTTVKDGVERAARGEVQYFSQIGADIDDHEPFERLFYPDVDNRPWREMTPAIAVQAIDNFLSGNTKDPWGFFRPANPEGIIAAV
jgi:hypothetical protein